MINTSISYTIGKGSIPHNLRRLINELAHIDKSKSKLNEILLGDDDDDLLIKKINEFYSQAVERHNASTTRKDRKIKNAYDYLSKKGSRTGKRKLFKDFVIQMGSAKGTHIPARIETKIYQEYIQSFQERNPCLKPFLCVLHRDEGHPHIHLDVIPVNHTTTKFGLGNSFNGALDEMGYPKTDRLSYARWRHNEVKELDKIMQKYGYRYEYQGNTNRHQDTIHPYEAVAIEEKIKEEIANKTISDQGNAERFTFKQKVEGKAFTKEEVKFVKNEDFNKVYDAYKTSLNNKNAAIASLKAKNDALLEATSKKQLDELEEANRLLQEENKKLKEDNERKNATINQLCDDLNGMTNKMSWWRGIAKTLKTAFELLIVKTGYAIKDWFKPENAEKFQNTLDIANKELKTKSIIEQSKSQAFDEEEQG